MLRSPFLRQSSLHKSCHTMWHSAYACMTQRDQDPVTSSTQEARWGGSGGIRSSRPVILVRAGGAQRSAKRMPSMIWPRQGWTRTRRDVRTARGQKQDSRREEGGSKPIKIDELLDIVSDIRCMAPFFLYTFYASVSLFTCHQCQPSFMESWPFFRHIVQRACHITAIRCLSRHYLILPILRINLCTPTNPLSSHSPTLPSTIQIHSWRNRRRPKKTATRATMGTRCLKGQRIYRGAREPSLEEAKEATAAGLHPTQAAQ